MRSGDIVRFNRQMTLVFAMDFSGHREIMIFFSLPLYIVRSSIHRMAAGAQLGPFSDSVHILKFSICKVAVLQTGID